MTKDFKENKKTLDPSKAVQLADRIWWVGHALPDDRFQCHVYLIENGENSVLIDPGSKLTFKHVLKKVEEIIPFNHIRYFICHHQDPDITGALPLIDQLVTRDDAMIISHWRAIALLKHYGLDLPLWCVEENGWTLDLGQDRVLEFVFTPYLHFPGAFCTFDRTSKVLFSSDIFGGFSDSFSLFAEDESSFESIRFFHEHYMPSREILFHGLTKLEKYPIALIAPQHGSIIPENMVNFYFQQLKTVDCGIYLLTQTSTDILHLSRLNNMLRRFMESMVLYKSFSDIAQSLLKLIREILPVESFECFSQTQSGTLIHLAQESMYRGIEAKLPPFFRGMMGMDKLQWETTYDTPVLLFKTAKLPKGKPSDKGKFAILPLLSQETHKIHGLTLIHLSQQIHLDGETAQTLVQISIPLSVAVEREMIHQSLEMEKQKFYEQAIHDPLTHLYTRVYMNESVKRIFSIQDRNPLTGVSLIMFDIDYFKQVNDTFGHNAGDVVLKAIADIVMAAVRESDIPVRMGGEEFAVFVTGKDYKTAGQIAERVRRKVARLKMPPPMENLKLTLSAGVVFRNRHQSLSDLTHQVDKALYQAKNQGRNQVVIAG